LLSRNSGIILFASRKHKKKAEVTVSYLKDIKRNGINHLPAGGKEELENTVKQFIPIKRTNNGDNHHEKAFQA
jgi:hypothetical protein